MFIELKRVFYVHVQYNVHAVRALTFWIETLTVQCVYFVLSKNVRNRATKTAHQIFTGILGTLAKQEERAPAFPSVLQSGHHVPQSPWTVMYRCPHRAQMQAQKAPDCQRYLQVTLMVD